MEWNVKKSVLFLGILVLIAVSYFAYSQRQQFLNVIQETELLPEPIQPKNPEGLENIVLEKDAIDSLQKVPGKLDIVKGGIGSIKEYFDSLQNRISNISSRTRIIVGVAMIAAIIGAIMFAIVVVIQQQQLRKLQEQLMLEQESQVGRLAQWLNPPEPGSLQSVLNMGYNVYFVVSLFVVFSILVLLVLSLAFYWDTITDWLGGIKMDMLTFLEWIKTISKKVFTYATCYFDGS
jgi:hypothetical protein